MKEQEDMRTPEEAVELSPEEIKKKEEEEEKIRHRALVEAARKENEAIANGLEMDPEEEAKKEAEEKEKRIAKVLAKRAKYAQAAGKSKQELIRDSENNKDFYTELPSKMKKKKKKKKKEKSPFIPGVDDSAWTEPLKEGEEYAIKVRDVKIRYKSVQSYSIKRSLLRLKKVNTQSFEAVKGVSFEVKKGEIFGITGKNGSGKSTLLRALGHIFSPDEGTIDLYGHSVSLLAIGVGFMKDLTGRENIMLSGMLLGFTEQEVKDHMDDIIDFAGLGDFIDMPVRTYSSGMYSKLAFSITAFLDTDIMLIDEVFSVGDAKFKKKSYAKMQELISEKNRTVVIVSHNLFTLETLCDRVMWLHDGKIVKIGDPLDIIEEYRDFMS